MIGMLVLLWLLIETIENTHCMQKSKMMDVASLQPSATWIKGSLPNPKLVIPSIVFGLGHSTTKLLDRIITLEVVFSKLSVCFLVFFQLWARPAHWKERNVNQVVAARDGFFFPPRFVFWCSLLQKSPDCKVIFSRSPVVNAVTSSLEFCKALGFCIKLCFWFENHYDTSVYTCWVGDCNSLSLWVDTM